MGRLTENPLDNLDQGEPNGDTEQEEPPRRNPERPRHLPLRFQQNVADISIFIQGNGHSNPEDPLPSFVESRRKEINGLLEKEAFDPTNSSHIPEGVRIFGYHYLSQTCLRYNLRNVCSDTLQYYISLDIPCTLPIGLLA